MGTYVRLSVEPALISSDAWHHLYDETLQLLKSWPDPPLGIQERVIAGQKLVVYTRDFEDEDGWRIVGDTRSRRRAEAFSFPRSPRWLGSTSSKRDEVDILTSVVRGTFGSGVFSEKTQGEPYHDLLVAVGLLAETRLPGLAVVHGDISYTDGEKARDALAVLFGESFELPVVMDEARIRAHVPADTPRLEAFLATYRPRRSDAIVRDVLAELYRHSVETRLYHELENDALICTDVNTLGPEARTVLEDLGMKLVNVSKGLAVDPRTGAVRLPRPEMLEQIAQGTVRMHLHLTEMAWDEILACDGDSELSLAWVLSRTEASARVFGLMARAAFESRAVRRFVLSSYQSEFSGPRSALRV